jgi:hypothetical protein
MVYEQATGATINWGKSSGVPIGRWDQTRDIGGARYKEDTEILGIYFGTTIGKTIDNTWQEKVQKIRHCMKDCNIRKLDINQRLRFSNTWYLSEIWYAAQIIPIIDKYAQQLTTTILQYIWRGWIFCVPVSTLYRHPIKGGIVMVDIKAKCNTLYITRLLTQSKKPETVTALWLSQHKGSMQLHNPPNWTFLSPPMEYLRTDMQKHAYIGKRGKDETDSQYKRRIYEMQRNAQHKQDTSVGMRVQMKFPVPSRFLLCSEYLGEFLALQDLLYLCFDEDTGFDLCLRQLREEVSHVLECC